jgi:hypothetical protein
MRALRGLLPLGVVFALDFAALFVSRWVAIGLASAAAVFSIVWLVYLLHTYNFPWPWRAR